MTKRIVSRPWTTDDIKELKELVEKWYNNKTIANLVWRNEIGISLKRKRLTKVENTYNAWHISDKYETNLMFMDLIYPDSVLDVYAGNWYYKDFELKRYVTNDKWDFQTDHSMEAFEFLAMFYNDRFDIVDLDPFGSAFECLDLAIRIAKKGLIITLWEMGHRRFKRTDFVRKRYWIESMNEDWVAKIIAYIENRGIIWKKKLTPVFIKNWNNISRVYFKIEPYKEPGKWFLTE